jgi:FHA domain
VYPSGSFKESTLNAIKTSSRYVPRQVQPLEPRPPYRRGERQPTEPPEICNVPEHCNEPCIELRLSNIPRSHHGLVFGTDPDSDVVLPNWKGIGYHHFTLTFDEANRLIVKDWGSLVGTEVTYDNEGHGLRREFQWIVGGDNVPKREKILIKLLPTVSVELQIDVACYDTKSAASIDKIGRFRDGTATVEGLFGDLDIPNRPETEWPTEAQTPGTGEIHLKKKIGEGTFAV